LTLNSQKKFRLLRLENLNPTRMIRLYDKHSAFQLLYPGVNRGGGNVLACLIFLMRPDLIDSFFPGIKQFCAEFGIVHKVFTKALFEQKRNNLACFSQFKIFFILKISTVEF
jgi:hypothetical protein